MQIVECFKILNVSPGEDWREVRKSYHSLARQFHPDINPEMSSSNISQGDAQLKAINQAFEKLEKHYKSNVLPDQRVSSDLVPDDNKFDGFFAGLRKNPTVQRAYNSSMNFLVELDTQVFHLDIQKDINISDSILQTGASVHLRSGKDRLEIKVPSGDWNTMSLRIPGKGETSLFSKRRGDLVLNLIVPTRETVKTENARLHYEMKISNEQIAQGKVMTLNSSEGPIKFTLPQNTRDGQNFTLRSKQGSDTLHILTVRLN